MSNNAEPIPLHDLKKKIILNDVYISILKEQISDWTRFL